jgi:hypothetical protein
MKITFRLKGGEGSGNEGHAGIPGHQGGSKPTGRTSESDHKDKPKVEEPKKKRWSANHKWEEFNQEGNTKVYHAIGHSTDAGTWDYDPEHPNDTSVIKNILHILTEGGINGARDWYGRSPSAYFTAIESEAYEYGHSNVMGIRWEGEGRKREAKVIPGHFGVVEFELPNELDSKVLPDPEGNKSYHWTSAFRLQGTTIKSDYINNIKVYDEGKLLYTLSKDQWIGKSSKEIEKTVRDMEASSRRSAGVAELKEFGNRNKSKKYYLVIP